MIDVLTMSCKALGTSSRLGQHSKYQREAMFIFSTR